MTQATRRGFLKTAVAGGVISSALPAMAQPGPADAKTAPAAPGGVDRRPLGKIKTPVSILGLGLGSVFTNVNKDPEDAARILEHALAKGINYWDTSRGYGNSETLIGPSVAKHRKEIFLVTKSAGRTYDAFMKDFETSLKELQTDHIDLCHIWNLKAKENLDVIETGALKAVRKLKDDKTIGAYGISGHSGAAILEQAITRFDPDAILTIFPCTRPDNGRYEDKLLPMARARNMGVIAMKTVRHARNADLKGSDLIRYALSLEGVCTAIVGTDTIEHINENAAATTKFKALSAKARADIHDVAVKRLAGVTAPWDQPGYDDGKWA